VAQEFRQLGEDGGDIEFHERSRELKFSYSGAGHSNSLEARNAVLTAADE
jgi:hypothetical protein